MYHPIFLVTMGLFLLTSSNETESDGTGRRLFRRRSLTATSIISEESGTHGRLYATREFSRRAPNSMSGPTQEEDSENQRGLANPTVGIGDDLFYLLLDAS